MKTSKTILSGVLAVAVATLTACGGGSYGNSPTPFDNSEFLGTWKRNDGTASGNPAHCFPFSTYSTGSNYGALRRSIDITANNMTETVEVYADTTCASFLGLFVQTYSVAWSAGSVPGKTNVARAVITPIGFSIQRNGTPDFSLTGVPTTSTTKELFDVDGTLLYVGDHSAPLRADEYPTQLATPALYTR